MTFISPAFAAEVTDAAAATPEAPSMLVTFAPLVLVFFVFYVLVIRPQNRRFAEHRKSLDALQKGDKVITGGGLVATVKKLQGDDEIVLEIANGVEVTAMRHSITSVRKAS